MRPGDLSRVSGFSLDGASPGDYEMVISVWDQLAGETLEQLNAVLPPTWSHGNPVDIIGDAPGSRYRGALEALLADRGTDAVLVMNLSRLTTTVAIEDRMGQPQKDSVIPYRASNCCCPSAVAPP